MPGRSCGVVAVPTIFAKARERGLSTAAFFSKSKFHHLEVPRTLNHSEAPDGSTTWHATRTVANVTRYLRSETPNLLFVHLAEPDYAGHRFGWMSWFYGRAVRQADGAVAELLQAADAAFGKGNYAVLLTADHGGHGWSHGSSDPRDVTIPWIAWAFQPGNEPNRSVHFLSSSPPAKQLDRKQSSAQFIRQVLDNTRPFLARKTPRRSDAGAGDPGRSR